MLEKGIMRMKNFLLILSLLFVFKVFAADCPNSKTQDCAQKNVCERFLKGELVKDPTDGPNQGEKKLYLGEYPKVNCMDFLLIKNYEKARKCALSRGKNDLILATLYANGLGTTKNLNLALKFICDMDQEGMIFSEAEEEDAAKYIEEMRLNKKNAPFNFCMFATTGANMAYCTRMAGEQEVSTLKSSGGKWSEKAKRQLDDLTKLSSVFIDADAILIADAFRGGQAYSAEYEGAIQEKRKAFLQKTHHLLSLSEQDLTKSLDEDLKKADSELNQIYMKKIATGDSESNKLLKNAQKKWLSYRDAWGKLFSAHFEGELDESTSKKWSDLILTKNRTLELDKLEVIEK
jgi:uncharacterized protein YecT (DUF1311 family)